MKPQNGHVHYRSMTADIVAQDDDLIELSVSSDLPYLREFGYEVLEHKADAVKMQRLLNGAPVLTDHNHTSHVGVVERAWLDDNKLRTTIRFSKSAKGREIEQDVRDGIRRNVSVGYFIHKWDDPKERAERDGMPVYRAVSWEPFEVSLVSVPADYSVGVGRSIRLGDGNPDSLPILIYDTDNVLVEAILPDGTVVTDPATLASLAAEQSSSQPEAEVTVDDATEAVDSPSIVEAIATVQTQLSNVAEALETIATELVITEEAASTESEVAEEVTSEEGMTEDADEEASDSAEQDSANNPTPTRIAHISVTERNTMKNNLDTINANIKLTDKEQKQYSLARAIVALSDGKRSGFEFEVSDEIAKKRGDTSGFYMPTSIRSFAISDSATAGAFTFTQGGDFIDYLRNRAVVASLGATTLTLPSKVAFPRLTSDLTATWISEDGSGASYASASLDQVVVSPKKLATYTGYSRETLQVANLDVDSMVRNTIYNSFVTAYDKAAIQGTGTSQPTGLLNVTGLSSGSASGSALSWSGAVALWSNVAAANADMGNLGYLASPGVVGKAKATIKSGSTAEFIVDGQGRIGTYNVAVSNNVPTLAGGGVLIFGDWSALMLAEFGAIEVITDPYTSKHKGIIEVGATMLGDVQVRNIAAFSIQKGLVTT